MNIFGFIWKWACPAVIMATLAYCCAKWQPPTYQRLDGEFFDIASAFSYKTCI